MGSDTFNGAADGQAPELENIADKFDHTNLSVAIGIAMRLQADTLKPGSELHVSLPKSDEVVDLHVLQIGKIEPEAQDGAAMPGALIDVGPLYGEAPDNYLAITFDPDEKIPASSRADLASYGVNAVDAALYNEISAGNGGQLNKLNLSWIHDDTPPEVLPATSEEFQAVGMKAAAQAAAIADRTPPTPEGSPKIGTPGAAGA